MLVASLSIPCTIAMGNAHVGILLIFCLISVGLAQPVGPILAYQDSLGQYSFGYSAPGSARSEIRTIDGETRGAYSYIDDAGVIQSTQYIADGANGFRVAATNLPQAPLTVQGVQDTGAVRVTDVQEELSEEKEGRTIGEGNVFLKGLVADLQANEKGVIKPDDEKKLMGADEKKTIDGMLKSASELESEAGVKVTQSVQPERSKVSNSEQIFETLKRSKIPVLRISPENLPIYPTGPLEPMNVQGSPITPASTVLKSSQEVAGSIDKASSKGLTVSVEEQEQSTDPSQGTVTSVQILPSSPGYPPLLRYTTIPTLHYVFYNSQ